MPAEAPFLPRVLALRGHGQGAAISQKLLDAYLLGPLLGRPCRTMIPDPGPRLGDLLQDPNRPIHWIRPGGLGDWAVLAPFIEGVRLARRHAEDTLWVTGGAFPFARVFHEGSGLKVRLAGAQALLGTRPPGLVLQLEPFHPTAWIWTAMLRPQQAAGYAPRMPVCMEGPPLRPVLDDMQAFHPGVIPLRPAPAKTREGILVFESGNHRSRSLPPAFAERLRLRAGEQVKWFGANGGPTAAPGWTWEQDRLPPQELLALIGGARLVISPDSGPFHLARLLGTPVLGYFTSGESARWGWPEPASRMLRSGFFCTDCTRIALPAPCPYGYRCRDDGDIPRLIEAVEELLAE